MKPARVFALSFPLTALLFLANAVAGQESGKQTQAASATPTSRTANSENSPEGDSSESKAEDRKTHVHLGNVTLGAAYGRGFYPNGPYGFYPYESLYYDPFWSPFWGSYYGGPNLAYDNGKGEVKLAADPQDAAVYVDGAYAGTAKHLKNIWLDPGAYDLSVSAAGRETFQQRVYVLSGKTLKLSAKLAYENGKP
jgi:hypothetical protein